MARQITPTAEPEDIRTELRFESPVVATSSGGFAPMPYTAFVNGNVQVTTYREVVVGATESYATLPDEDAIERQLAFGPSRFKAGFDAVVRSAGTGALPAPAPDDWV